MKVVFDTNVLVSALITTGKPRELFNMVIEGRIQLVLSKGILKEFLEVSSDRRIIKYANQEEVIAFLRIIDNVVELTKVKSRFKIIKDDPDDDVILRTAFDGKADFIVSGDKHLLSLREFRGIKICTVDEILKAINEEKT